MNGVLTNMLVMTQLSTGMWSVRNEDGDRVGYYGFRNVAIEELLDAGYTCTHERPWGGPVSRYDGSRWEKKS